MIIAGESSGELYGSLLAKALKNKWPGIQITGVGGSRMKESGVELISPISDAFGLVEAVSAFGKIKAAFRKSVEAMKKLRPAVLVLIDYPDFNLKLAEVAKGLGIKILYYVSPQVWAWRKGRVKKIAHLVDKMAVILPFEEKIYRDAGLPCEFVGHPVLEEIQSVLGTAESFSAERRSHFKVVLDFDPEKSLLSFLPGSRPSELKRHLPLIVKVIRQFKNDPAIRSGKELQFCMPLASNTDMDVYASWFGELSREGVVIKKGDSVKVLAASDLAVVTSGTATLQTALLEVPMVVIYRLSPLTYQLGKRIVKVKYISLVNILSGKEVVTELIQDKANPEEIINELRKILFDAGHREKMLGDLRSVKDHFLGKDTSNRVASIVMEMAGGQ
jgi:lipid-A-disaccharide synthase